MTRILNDSYLLYTCLIEGDAELIITKLNKSVNYCLNISIVYVVIRSILLVNHSGHTTSTGKSAIMRLLGFFLFAVALLCNTAVARQHTPPSSQDSELIEQGDYTNSDGQEIHRPAHTKSGKAPDGASAQCRDGTYSFSTHRRGTCSRHGGVAAWLN